MMERTATSTNETRVLFQKAYPVSFRILNEKMEEKIYLQDKPSSGFLELRNDSGREIHFVPAHHEAMAGPDDYHFALKFRPGILKSDTKSLVKHKIIKKGWTMSMVQETAGKNGNGTTESPVVIYFLNNTKASLAVGEKILLPLKRLLMEADEGTQVTQVELSCRNLSKNATYTQVLHPHIRHFNLTLINHRGNPVMPIHVGFTGFNAILNDGTPNRLTLRITNQQKRKPQSKGKFTFSRDKHSRMYLYFETDPEKSDYALGPPDQVAGIQMEIVLPQQEQDQYGNAAQLVHEPMFQGNTPVWEINPEFGDVVLQAHQTKLNPDGSSLLPDDSCMDIVLSDIRSNAYMGTTYLYLRLENIPGYWDHTYAIPIVKQPMVFYSEYWYDVFITDFIEYANMDELYSIIEDVVSGMEHQGIKLDLSIEEISQAVGDEHKKKTYPKVKIKSCTSKYEAERLKKFIKDYDNNLGVEITFRDVENVGIGTSKPTNKLSVEGNANFNGNVGIGNPIPNNKLSVKGNVDISGNVGIGKEPDATHKLSVAGDSDFQGDVKLTGNIGIGKDPDRTNDLSVRGGADFGGNVKIDHSNNDDNNDPALEILSNEWKTALHIGQYGKIIVDSNTLGGRFSISENDGVGIGYLNNPSGKRLAVKGDVVFDGFSISSKVNDKWNNILIGNKAAILTFIGTVNDTLIHFSVIYSREEKKFAKLFDLNDNKGDNSKRLKWEVGKIQIDSSQENRIEISHKGKSYELLLEPQDDNDEIFANIKIVEEEGDLHRVNDIDGRFKSFAF
jgi:hypothetical protein